MKLLILHPDLKKLGGIEGYYLKLCKHFSISVEHFTVGKRVGESGKLTKLTRLFADYLAFDRLLKGAKIDIVQVNPSLEFKSFIREGIFVLLAKRNKAKVVTFFRGWDVEFQKKIDRFGPWFFRLLYGRSDTFVVLSEAFSKILCSWVDTASVVKEFTIVDDKSLEGFDAEKELEKRQQSENWRILFLARIFKQKGIYETLEAYQILKARYPGLELVVAGDGVELPQVKAAVHEKQLADVSFTGDIRGQDKDRLFKSAHAFCFPTFHAEGLPNAILEAMAFGLPVVTRPVGGLLDFFQDGTHGFLTKDGQPESVAALLEKLIADKDLYNQISLQNAAYAKKHFSSAQAALRFEELYRKLIAEAPEAL